MTEARIAVIAVGGNSLIVDENRQSIPDQYQAAATSSEYVAEMVAEGWNVILTHGNGPQVGFILRRSELSIHELAPVPMDYAGADTQGAIGYMFQRALHNAFRRRGIGRRAIAVVTQVVVDRDDPAFRDPTKPIGSHMDEQTARERARKHDWRIREDAGRGWRRVVASPLPRTIVEGEEIALLARAGYVVIACGGGIPVIADDDGDLQGVEAVIDKDFASGLLAQQVGAELFMLSTGVERVAINFNQPNQRWLERISVSEAKRYAAQGHFAAGSMGPKVEALVAFLEIGGKQDLITNPPNIGRALKGDSGTLIVPDG